MNDTLIKPFDPDELFSILVKFLDQRSRSHEDAIVKWTA
jgi:hypothetical protein